MRKLMSISEYMDLSEDVKLKYVEKNLVVAEETDANLNNKMFVLDYIDGTVFNKQDNKFIHLTALEKALLLALYNNPEHLSTYEHIEKNVWSKKSKMSIYTLRNFIKKLRDKTYPEIIKNKSGHGYTLDIF